MDRNMELAVKIDRTVIQCARFLKKILRHDSPIAIVAQLISAETLSEIAGMQQSETMVALLNSQVYCHSRTPDGLRFKRVWGRNVRFMSRPSRTKSSLIRPNFHGSNLLKSADFSNIRLIRPQPYIPSN